MRNRRLLLPTGFTLIELMITVAVVAILAAIALPSYQEHVMRSRRADAKGVLLEAAQLMERNFTERGAYNKNCAGTVKTTLLDLFNTCTTPGTADSPVVASPLLKAPKDGATKHYDIQITGATKYVYTLQAVPITGTAQANDQCGTLTISNTGAKGQATGKTVDDCWNR